MKKIYITSFLFLSAFFSKAEVHTINITTNGFSETNLTIQKGDTVDFIWNAGDDNHPVDINVGNGESFSLSTINNSKRFILDEGTYHFMCKNGYCKVHSLMHGNINVLNTTTGLANSKIADVQVYPNPAVSNDYLKIDNGLLKAERVIFKSLSGENVLMQNLDEGINSLGIDLPAGMYYLLLEGKGEMIGQKKFQVIN